VPHLPIPDVLLTRRASFLTCHAPSRTQNTSFPSSPVMFSGFLDIRARALGWYDVRRQNQVAREQFWGSLGTEYAGSIEAGSDLRETPC